MAFDDLIATTDRAVQSHLGGVAVIYTTEAGTPVSVNVDGDPLLGMFDENYVTAEARYNGVETGTPAVVLRLEDLPTDPREEDPTVTILSTIYSIRARETDGVAGGSVRLVLRKVTI